MLLSVLFVASCSSDDDYVEATLDVSTTQVTLSGGTMDQTIAITTNQTKWIASSPAEGEWLMLEQQGNNLVVRAMENLVVKERVSYILVMAGGAAEKVMVKQSAADIVLEASPGEINVPNIGGKYLVDITSNSANWTIEKEAAADWVIIKQFAEGGFAELTVLKNETGTERSLKLFAKNGSKLEEIIINQAGGGGSSKFMMPLLKHKPTRLEILEHEKAWGSHLLIYEAPMPSWGIYAEIYIYALNSSVFYSSDYEIDTRDGMLLEINLWSEQNAKEIISKEYIELLEDEGFIIERNDKGFTGVNLDNMFTVFAIVDLNADLGRVLFTPFVEQDKAYPTFESFPYDRSPWLFNSDYPISRIKEIEESEGSEIIGDDIDLLDVIVVEQYRPLYERLFLIEDNLTSEFVAIWDDPHVGAWSPDGGGSTWKLTSEFLEVMEDAGFVYYFENEGHDFYFNAEKELMIVPRGESFFDVLDGEPVFCINYFYHSESAGAGLLNRESRNKLAKEFSEKLKKSDARLNTIR